MMTAAITSLFNIHQLLPALLAQYGSLVYVGLFVLIFIETGLVVFPFLPGDSVLFLTGTIAAMSGQLNPVILVSLLSVAAILGDAANFEIGKRFGHHISTSPKWQRWIKPERLEQAHAFFVRHGHSAIFLGRFMPIIRTFVPFTAGTSRMPYRRFVTFNVLGGLAWVTVAVLAGFFFGNIAFVQSHFELIMVAIVVISLIPAGIMALKNRSVAAK